MKNQYFFISNTKYKKEDILIWKKQELGYCNDTYYCKTKDQQEYKIRIAQNNDLINRNNEIQSLKLIQYPFIYFDKKTYNYIEKWNQGSPLKKEEFNKHWIQILIKEVKKIHSTPITKDSNIKLHNNLQNPQALKENISPKIFQKIQELNNKYSNPESLVLCHNDLNPNNIIINPKTNTIKIIDFEWSAINNPYWDYANLLREISFSKEKLDLLNSLLPIPNKEALIENYILSLAFSFQWVYNFKKTPSLLGYAERNLYFLNKIYKETYEMNN